jgi:hypothetical protein
MMLIPLLTNGWLGYFVQCAAAYGTGSLQERVLPNTTVFASTSGGGPAGIQPLPAATSPLSSAVYNSTFTLEPEVFGMVPARQDFARSKN